MTSQMLGAAAAFIVLVCCHVASATVREGKLIVIEELTARDVDQWAAEKSDSQSLWLLVLTKKQCGHCRNLKVLLRKALNIVSERLFSDSSSVQLVHAGVLDCSTADGGRVCAQFNVREVPAMFSWASHRGLVPLSLDGVHTSEDLAKIVTDLHAQNRLHFAVPEWKQRANDYASKLKKERAKQQRPPDAGDAAPPAKVGDVVDVDEEAWQRIVAAADSKKWLLVLALGGSTEHALVPRKMLGFCKRAETEWPKLGRDCQVARLDCQVSTARLCRRVHPERLKYPYPQYYYYEAGMEQPVRLVTSASFPFDRQDAQVHELLTLWQRLAASTAD